jgi:hypothetical protein
MWVRIPDEEDVPKALECSPTATRSDALLRLGQQTDFNVSCSWFGARAIAAACPR